MKTTFDLPSEHVKETKLQAVHEGRKLKDVAVEIFRRGLNSANLPVQPIPKIVKLPLVECRHAASPDLELTPEKVAEIVLRQEVAAAL